jgi:hypothetical protein
MRPLHTKLYPVRNQINDDSEEEEKEKEELKDGNYTIVA